MESIILALATPIVTLIGVVLANRKSAALSDARIDNLEEVVTLKIDTLTKHVEKHNGVIDRVYDVEIEQAICKEQLKTVFNQQKEKK